MYVLELAQSKDAAKCYAMLCAALTLVEDLCLSKGVHSIRVDTDFYNGRMQHILEKGRPVVQYKYTRYEEAWLWNFESFAII